MKATEALAVGFRHTHRAWPIIGLGFVIGLGLTLMRKLSEGGTPVGLAATVLSALMFFLMAVLFAALWVLWSGGLLGWIRDRLSGTPTTWARFYETGSRLFWRLCLLLILEGAMIIGAFLMGALGCAILFRLSPIIAGILGIALTLPATFLLMFLVTYSGVSLVEHDLGAVASIKDSMRFTWSYFWGTVWLISLISLGWIGLSAVVAVPIGGFLVFKLSFKETARLFLENKLPLPLILATDAVGAYGWVLCNVACYAYYLGNQPALAEPISSEPTTGPSPKEESS